MQQMGREVTKKESPPHDDNLTASSFYDSYGLTLILLPNNAIPPCTVSSGDVGGVINTLKMREDADIEAISDIVLPRRNRDLGTPQCLLRAEMIRSESRSRSK
jgi:hypothetical protein